MTNITEFHVMEGRGGRGRTREGSRSPSTSTPTSCTSPKCSCTSCTWKSWWALHLPFLMCLWTELRRPIGSWQWGQQCFTWRQVR